MRAALTVNGEACADSGRITTTPTAHESPAPSANNSAIGVPLRCTSAGGRRPPHVRRAPCARRGRTRAGQLCWSPGQNNDWHLIEFGRPRAKITSEARASHPSRRAVQSDCRERALWRQSSRAHRCGHGPRRGLRRDRRACRSPCIAKLRPTTLPPPHPSHRRAREQSRRQQRQRIVLIVPALNDLGLMLREPDLQRHVLVLGR